VHHAYKAGQYVQQSLCKIPICGSDRDEERKIDSLSQDKGEYLFVPNTPVEVCLECGMVYYEANVLKEIERHCFAIHANTEQPDRSLELPSKEFDGMIAV
jgi:YgiT-type zinc finger domain-containing protein